MRSGVIEKVLAGIIGVSNLLFNLYANEPSPGSGLIAHYAFDGNAKDLSLFGNDGTVHKATLTTDRFGNAASAYLSNGSSSYIEMAKPLPDMTAASFSVWITAPPAGFVQAVFFEGDTTSGFDFAAHFNSLSHTEPPALLFPTKNDSSLVYAFGTRDTTRWFHIVGVADAGRRRKELWVDGVLVASGAFTGPANVGRHYRLQVGRSADGPGRGGAYFQGKIDDLRIFNRGITSEEIESLRLNLRIQRTIVFVDGSAQSGVSLTFDSLIGKVYQLQKPSDQGVWEDFGGGLTGTGGAVSVSLPTSDNVGIFRLRRN